MNNIKMYLQRWLLVILWAGLIFFLSSQPHLPGPQDSTLDFLFKKCGHLVAYGTLFALAYRAYGKKTPHRVVQSFLLCIFYALTDEFHQSFVPGRTPMLRDVGIDIIGMSIAWVILRRLFLPARRTK